MTSSSVFINGSHETRCLEVSKYGYLFDDFSNLAKCFEIKNSFKYSMATFRNRNFYFCNVGKITLCSIVWLVIFVHSNLVVVNKTIRPFLFTISNNSLYQMYILLSKSSKWELGFVQYFAKFTISRFVISRFECT